MKKKSFYSRKRPAHLPSLRPGNRSVIQFVTVCTKDRKEILHNEAARELILEAWNQADHYRVGCYVIMPDHLHLFCSPATEPPEKLQGWCKYWKSLVAQSWPYPSPEKLWLRGYWDRQLRSGESYREKWDYVRNNPVRASLVENADDWPYYGELNILEWHD